MARMGKTAWLITDEQESGRGPVRVLAVMGPARGRQAIEDAVEMFWRALHLNGAEKLQYMAPNHPSPYRPEWAGQQCYCGQGAGLVVARRVSGLQEVPRGQGFDGLVWDSMPDPATRS